MSLFLSSGQAQYFSRLATHLSEKRKNFQRMLNSSSSRDILAEDVIAKSTYYLGTYCRFDYGTSTILVHVLQQCEIELCKKRAREQ